jgi:hypothetical protein
MYERTHLRETREHIPESSLVPKALRFVVLNVHLNAHPVNW